MEIEPNLIIIKALKYLDNNIKKEKNIMVLDIGAGDGKDSLFFAKKGFVVSAIDSSAYFIHKINQLAKIHNVEIKTVITNALTFQFDNYNILICNNILHFLKNEQIQYLINKMKIRTLSNGINIISFIQNKNIESINIDNFYKDWKILYHNESLYYSINRKKEKKFVELIAMKI